MGRAHVLLGDNGRGRIANSDPALTLLAAVQAVVLPPLNARWQRSVSMGSAWVAPQTSSTKEWDTTAGEASPHDSAGPKFGTQVSIGPRFPQERPPGADVYSSQLALATRATLLRCDQGDAQACCAVYPTGDSRTDAGRIAIDATVQHSCTAVWCTVEAAAC
jgi:hypothetical protein